MKPLTPKDYFVGPTDYGIGERQKLEKTVEADSVAWARRNGWFTRKYSSPGQKGVQDRIFVKESYVIFIEYKRIGNVPTDLQCDDAEDLQKHGGSVYWTNTLRGTIQILGEGV